MTRIGQKFQIGDSVKEANAFGSAKDNFARRTGVITGVEKKKNARGHEHFHYEVIWNGHTAPTERVQHRLASA